MTDFCTRLKSERKRLGLSQAEMGGMGGVSKDAQLNYENGSRHPDSAYLQRVASGGVDIAFLVSGRRSAAEVPFTVEDLVDAYEKADHAGRAALEAVARIAVKGGDTAPMDARSSGGNMVMIGGDVGQSIAGDAHQSGPVTFKVGKKR